MHILVAEDSPDNRLLVQLYLEGSPHSLTCVEHGGEAVERAASEEFDVVLMDVQMPVMDGLTATRKIRAMELERGGRAVPILALSANARPEDIASSLEAGCTVHLSKRYPSNACWRRWMSTPMPCPSATPSKGIPAEPGRL